MDAADLRARQAVTRVLVTGASGFIGRPLTEALAGSGYEVRAAVRQSREEFASSGVDIVAVPDLAGPVDWPALVAGMDAVVHLAGIAHAGSGTPEAAYDRVNHAATGSLARAASAAGARLVFLSSIRAQSGPRADHPLTEADEPHPTDAYGRSKLAAEAAVRASGVRSTILRPVLVYGAGAKGNLASLSWLAALPLPLPLGSLVNRRSLLARDNLIAAIRFALDNPRADNQSFIVSDPGALSVAEIVSILRQARGRSAALFPLPPTLIGALLGLIGRREQWDRLAGSLVAEPAKLLAAGWRPVVETAAGLTAMVQAASPRKSGTASRSTP
jgi:nucleoside-diphosphate-sugar epimerase